MEVPYVFQEGLLAGKVALVTGGASGIGYGISHRLARAANDGRASSLMSTSSVWITFRTPLSKLSFRASTNKRKDASIVAKQIIKWLSAHCH